MRLLAWRSSFASLSLCLCLSLTAPVCRTKGRGLTFTVARVLVGAHVDGAGSQPTDTENHTFCVVRALMPTLTSSQLHVCHRQESGLSLLAPSRSRTWVFLRRLHILALRVLFDYRSRQKPRSKKLAIISQETSFSFCQCCNACFPPRRGHWHKNTLSPIGSNEKKSFFVQNFRVSDRLIRKPLLLID